MQYAHTFIYNSFTYPRSIKNVNLIIAFELSHEVNFGKGNQSTRFHELYVVEFGTRRVC